MWKRKKLLPPQPTSPKFEPTGPVFYPAGTAVVTQSGYYFIQRDGKKYKIPNLLVLESWSFPIIVETKDLAIVNYPLAHSKMPFRDGTLLNNISTGRVYIMSEGKARAIRSSTFLERLNLGPESAVQIDDSHMTNIKLGEDIY